MKSIDGIKANPCDVKLTSPQGFAFFAYCSDDSSVASAFIDMLSREGLRLWFEKDFCSIGEWQEAVEPYLKACQAVIMLISKKAIASHLIRKEMIYAADSGKLIIPLYCPDVQITFAMKELLKSASSFTLPRLMNRETVMSILQLPALKECMGSPDLTIPEVDLSSITLGSIEHVPLIKPPIISEPERPYEVSVYQPLQSDEPVKNETESSASLDQQSAEKQLTRPQQINSIDPAPVPIIKDPEATVINKNHGWFGDNEAEEKTVISDPDIPPVLIQIRNGRKHRGQIGVTLIGRSKICDIKLDDESKELSRQHARIISYEGNNTIQDMNTPNGTVVGGKRLTVDEVYRLSDFEEVLLAKERIILGFGKTAERLWKTDLLFALESIESGEWVYLFEGTLELGRSFPWKNGAMTSKNISRKHATIQITDKGPQISDHSQNGTYINDSNVLKNTAVLLQDRDRIQIGDEIFVAHVMHLIKEEVE